MFIYAGGSVFTVSKQYYKVVGVLPAEVMPDYQAVLYRGLLEQSIIEINDHSTWRPYHPTTLGYHTILNAVNIIIQYGKRNPEARPNCKRYKAKRRSKSILQILSNKRKETN